MKCIISWGCFVFYGIMAIAAQDSGSIRKVSDTFNFSEPYNVEMRGVMGNAMNASLAGDKLVFDSDTLIEPFRTRPETRYWDCEFWGKWFTGALLAYDYAPSPYFKRRLDKSIASLMATQDAEGSITTYQKEHEFKLNPKGWLTEGDKNSWDLWGRKYTLLGLIDYYCRTRDPKVLESAKRHTDYIMAQVCDGKKDIVQIGCWFGCASTSILEPIVLLYFETGDKKYLNYAEWIVGQWERSPLKPDLLNKALKGEEVFDMFDHPDPKYKGYLGGGKSKAYEMGSCFEGLVELYRATGNPLYKKAAENHAKSIRNTEINVVGSGSIEERWINGKFIQTNRSAEWDEVCVTATWIKICAQLLRLTGEQLYADDIELASYNALIGAEFKGGEWWAGRTVIDGVRNYERKAYCKKVTCCTTNGPRGLFLLPKIAFMTSSDGVVVNFYEKSAAALNTPAGKLDIVISDIDFCANHTAKISLSGMSGGEEFEIALRIPRWSSDTKVSVNGEDVGKVECGKYLKLKRAWKNGDVIEITFDSSTVAVKDPGGSGKTCLMHAMYVLSQDRRFEKKFDKPAKFKIKDGKVSARAVALKDVNAAFDVELEDGTTRRFIDYSSAGKTWSADSEIATWVSEK